MPSYIVVVSPSYGGAEKRFFDIFTGMRRSGVDIQLIGPSSLIDELCADHVDRVDVLPALRSVPMLRWSPLGFMRAFRAVLRTLPRGSNFHYPLNCLWPLHLGRGDHLSMSVVDCTATPAPFDSTRTLKWTWLAMYFCERIDVLSPTQFEALKRSRVKARLSLTPGGTFLVPPAPSRSPRLPAVIFLGRLVPLKGIDDFLDVLPGIWALLRARVPPGFMFRFAGYGVLQNHVVARIDRLAAAGVPVHFVGYAKADSLLAESAVVLSMQEITNFPSRVVAEGLVAGCGAIVRDTGDSRSFGTDVPGLVYCAATLNAAEIAQHIVALLERVMSGNAAREVIRQAARQRFSSQQYVDYFRNLVVDGSAAVQPLAIPTQVPR